MKPGLKGLLRVGLAVTLVLAGSVVSNRPAQAGGLRLAGSSRQSRAARFQHQTRLMDTRLFQQYKVSVRLQPNVTDQTVSQVLDNRIPAYRGKKSQHLHHARAAARKYGVPEVLFLRLVQQELGW